MVSRTADPETGVSVVPVSAISARSSSEQTVQSLTGESALMMLPDTPFFHLDLAAAVKAAEKTEFTADMAEGMRHRAGMRTGAQVRGKADKARRVDAKLAAGKRDQVAAALARRGFSHAVIRAALTACAQGPDPDTDT